ncbi:MAG: hypothetical protein Q4D39_02775 [Coriobacteriaceae bacterium]|nr:hypothetical protein [Coriobacteriaceae bacterium]
MPICFIICAIGANGSETREHADDLFEEISTALEPFGIDAMRGDHNLDTKQVDSDVIERIQNAELCIADLSEDNVNVYYELGRRDETGKPIILVRRRGLPPLPVDIAGRRFIEYEIETRRGARLFRDQLREAIRSESANGFEGSNGNATLAGVYQVLQRVERKIDRISKAAPSAKPTSMPSGDLPEGLSPSDAFNLALRTSDIPLAEAAMDRLQWTMEKNRFYDIVVEQTASLGSLRASEMMISYAQEFFDSDMSFKKKVEYLCVLVGVANRYDRELEIMDVVEHAAEVLDLQARQAPSGSVDSMDHAQVFNQLNRLYHGIFATTRDSDYLQKAINALKHAIGIREAAFLYYNLAMCERHFDLESARRDIDRCLKLNGGESDADHLELACKIYYEQGDPEYQELLERLRDINPQMALLLDLDN